MDLISKAKETGKEVLQLNGEAITLTDLLQASQSASMFGSDRIVVIENLFSRKKSKEQEDLFTFTKTYAENTDLVFWEKKAIGKIAQRSLPPKTTIKEFKTPALIFKLVEQIRPDNKQQALDTLQITLESQPAEFIFAMVVRQVRLLFGIKEGLEPKGAPWMIGKLKSQAAAFTNDQLALAYKKLYQIEKQIKTGDTPMNLGWHLSTWLATI